MGFVEIPETKDMKKGDTESTDCTDVSSFTNARNT